MIATSSFRKMKPTRSIWTGHVTFENVTIPVRVRAVVQSEAVRFKALHTCGRQIRQKTICPECGEIHRSEIQSGYPAENGQFVTVAADELKACQPASGRVLQIERCVSLREIDPVLFQKAYYLEPGAEGMTTYSLLRQALKAEGKCALTRTTLNRREHIAILRPWNSCLLLQTLFYTKEIQSAPEIVIPGRMIENAELSDLRALVDRSTGSFDHSRYRDRYQQAIRHLLQQNFTAHQGRKQINWKRNPR
jgi:DNA end-binding protein Ku